MGNESAIVFSGIAPHPPIMVPEVGGEAIADVRGSIEAMGELTRRIIESGAETSIHTGSLPIRGLSFTETSQAFARLIRKSNSRWTRNCSTQ